MVDKLKSEIDKLMNYHKRVSQEEALRQYDPQLWAFMYKAKPYLKHVGNEDLITRYYNLIRNKTVLFESAYFNKIGNYDCRSFLSKNYWSKKIVETQLEITERNLTVPPYPGTICNISFSSLVYPAIFVRYGQEQYMDQFYKEGIMRIGASSIYNDSDLNDAQFDNELKKDWVLDGKEFEIKTEKGQKIEAIGAVTVSKQTEPYFVSCMSLDLHGEIFNSFDYDTAIVIHNQAEFIRRLEAATENTLPEYELGHWGVEYYDPYLPDRNQHFSAFLSKDFKYAYQLEYRFVWFSKDENLPVGYQYLNLGSIEDIADIVYMP